MKEYEINEETTFRRKERIDTDEAERQNLHDL